MQDDFREQTMTKLKLLLITVVLFSQSITCYARGYSSYPVYGLPSLRSSIALIYDEETKQPLYRKGADEITSIASITKLMTAMVVLDAQLPMSEGVTIAMDDVDFFKRTHSRLRPGMRLTRGDLLKLALLASENRAAAALARTYPGGTGAAVAAMNRKAASLGMRNTYFLDPTGLHSENVSTASDLLKMVQAAERYPQIRQATTTSSQAVEVGGSRQLMFYNTNALVRSRSAAWDISLSKTGYINEAGRCLVMRARINQRPVVIVLLDSVGKRSRIGDANRIRHWMES
jgi:D-alanyl-D-alanine endopeptidase (penicillin-binding protein 7)